MRNPIVSRLSKKNLPVAQSTLNLINNISPENILPISVVQEIGTRTGTLLQT